MRVVHFPTAAVIVPPGLYSDVKVKSLSDTVKWLCPNRFRRIFWNCCFRFAVIDKFGSANPMNDAENSSIESVTDLNLSLDLRGSPCMF